MDSLILAYSFAAALALSAVVVLLFSRPIDEALSRVVPEEMLSAWRQYVKFALFVVTFAGGMRLSELGDFIAQHKPAGPPLTAGQGILEVLKTIAGSLIAASGTLLVFFAATLVIYASLRFYQSHGAAIEKTAAHPFRATERPAVGASRHAVGSERHDNEKDRHA